MKLLFNCISIDINDSYFGFDIAFTLEYIWNCKLSLILKDSNVNVESRFKKKRNVDEKIIC